MYAAGLRVPVGNLRSRRKSSLAGLSALGQKWVRATARLSGSRKRSKRLVLNVGGTHFEVSKHLLDLYPNTLLGSPEREFFYDFEKNEYVFDRDPQVFRHVLNYYRTGKLHYPEDERLIAYEQDLSFFGIDEQDLGHMISPCCREAYLDKKDALIQFQPLIDQYKPLPEPKCFRESLWYSMENPHRCAFGVAFFYVTMVFIVVSIASNVIETSHCPGPNENQYMFCGQRYPLAFAAIESASALVFTVEYILRLFASPDRWSHMWKAMSMVDLLSILPYYATVCLPKDSDLNGAFVTMRVLRVFRVFKLSRTSHNLRLLGYVLRYCIKDLSFLFFSLVMTMVIFSTILYYVERGGTGTLFTSVPATFWYVVVTMTTLGYGEMVAQSSLGKIVTGLCCVFSVLLLTLPVTVVVSNFNNLYKPEKLKKEGVFSPKRKRCTGPRLGKKEFKMFQAQHKHLLKCMETATDRKLTGLVLRYSYGNELRIDDEDDEIEQDLIKHAGLCPSRGSMT
ncbi:potassium voltage-gated channel protein Shal-like [Branchiostoma floridae]|uniref:Potassium voltage-gated channel protein Shal-like n=1 Tax=Branchiostoma floridae TaxID=7739 RepID=A0A9J7LWY6_BRAFL|nr:potassium voltage-gated channel protein Shal-like [Branchiostoma floridae]XP_035690642.1 potassium voltage-gated channel protein Shal-like [Branchiostoma floridae]